MAVSHSEIFSAWMKSLQARAARLVSALSADVAVEPLHFAQLRAPVRIELPQAGRVSVVGAEAHYPDHRSSPGRRGSSACRRGFAGCCPRPVRCPARRSMSQCGAAVGACGWKSASSSCANVQAVIQEVALIGNLIHRVFDSWNGDTVSWRIREGTIRLRPAWMRAVSM